jgi:hypothetical protein
MTQKAKENLHTEGELDVRFLDPGWSCCRIDMSGRGVLRSNTKNIPVSERIVRGDG